MPEDGASTHPNDESNDTATEPHDRLLQYSHQPEYETAAGVKSGNSTISTGLKNGFEVAKKPQQHRARDSSLLVSWWAELLAAICSFACIAGMVALLRSIDGRPYEQVRHVPACFRKGMLIYASGGS
jgi:hypothetical protein